MLNLAAGECGRQVCRYFSNKSNDVPCADLSPWYKMRWHGRGDNPWVMSVFSEQ